MSETTAGTLIARALRLRCPRCGEGKMFVNWFRMNATCDQCKFRYERDPGYFLGSTYVNYGMTALIITVTYVGLHFGAGYDKHFLLPPLLVFCVGFPMFFFRYARALWLAMDCYFDTSPKDDTQV